MPSRERSEIGAIDRTVDLDLLRAAVWAPAGDLIPTSDRRPTGNLPPTDGAGAQADGPPPSRLRPAAVLCAVAPRRDGLKVILIRRADHLKAHAGQIAFPGGKVDPTDRSPMAAALREAEEEIGLTRDLVDVLGPIDRHVTSTGYRVTPFVGVATRSFRPLVDPNEVAEVFEVPLDFLMNPANGRRCERTVAGVARRFHAIPWRDRFIWGATAMMLKNLSDRITAARMRV